MAPSRGQSFVWVVFTSLHSVIYLPFTAEMLLDQSRRESTKICFFFLSLLLLIDGVNTEVENITTLMGRAGLISDEIKARIR